MVVFKTVKQLLPDLLNVFTFLFLSFTYRLLHALSTDLNSSPENRLLTRMKA